MKYTLNENFLDKLKNSLSKEDFDKYLDEIDSVDKNGFTINLHKLSYATVDLEYIKKIFNATLIFKNEHYAYFIYDKKRTKYMIKQVGGVIMTVYVNIIKGFELFKKI